MCPLCKYDTRHVLTDLERMYSGPRIIIDQNGFEDILGDSFFSDSDSSSFMAESQARLPIYGKITNACSRAFHATVSPVQKLFRKIRHRRTRTLNTSTEIAMSITQEHSQARGLQQQQPFQDADVISGTSFTPDYTVGADGKYKSHNSEQTFKQGDHSRNHMIEVKTTDPLTPTSKQSVEVKDKADSTKLSQKNNKPSVPTNSSIEDVCMISSRISMSDIITSTSEIRKYYNQN
ncbi:hypothetical protein GGI07_000318 [Coemansia sp. Benny D115]|nr:hypothetical protein GGI07_000318 [Coemansia sp. Benny D115]